MEFDMYKRPVYDDKFHIKNFILSYKGLVNVKKLKENQREYLKNLDEIHSMTNGIDFNKNTLFICDKDISKEIFLVGFSRMKEIKTYYYCNMIDLSDIWWGNRKNTNNNISEDEVLFSDQDILQDVLCLYVSSDLYSTRGVRVVNSTISSRMSKFSKNGDSMLTWVFFCGTESDLRGDEFYIIRQMFEKGDGFQIVPLSGSISSFGPSVGKSYGRVDLEDMY